MIRTEEKRHGDENHRYSVLDCLSRKDVGRTVAISLSNGRIESGKLMNIGMFDIQLELPNKKGLIVMKHSIVTVSIL